MAKKEGGKNKKFGRHSRNPSSKMQAQRSVRNKEKRIARAHPKSHGHVCEKVSRRLPDSPIPVPMTSQHRQFSPPFYAVEVAGLVTVEFTPWFKDADLAYRRTYHPDVRVFKINDLGQRVEVNMKESQSQRAAA